ncbi:MAG: cysteine hydrolase family protein [Alphaproteobacteria bacterium]
MPPLLSVPCWQGLSYSFDPARTAFLAIDMQRDFLAEGGMCAQAGEDISALRKTVPIVTGLLEAARRASLSVIHTREGYAPDLSDMHELKRARHSAGQAGPLGRFLIRGEAGHDFIEECRPLDGETVIDKPGFSAFYKTDLEDLLRGQGISHLVIAGVTAQCCVFSTIRAAVDRGFYCLLLADACAALDPGLHRATLDIIQGEDHLFGWIADSAELIGALALDQR